MQVIDFKPFMEASTYVFEQLQIICKETKGEHHSASDSEILIMIGMTGDVYGQIVFRIPENAGLNIASSMLGRSVTVMDQSAQSGLLELGSIISKNAMSLLAKQGLSMNITPPTLIMGQSLEVSGSEVHTLSAMLTINETDMIELKVLYEKEHPCSL